MDLQKIADLTTKYFCENNFTDDSLVSNKELIKIMAAATW